MSENGNGQPDVLQGQAVSGRNAKGQWVKGVTGNPGGFNKPSRLTIRDVLRFQDAEHAAHVLRSNLTSGDPEVRHKAAVYILDQLFGKPKESVEMSGPDGGAIQVEEVRNELRERFERIVAASGSIPEAN